MATDAGADTMGKRASWHLLCYVMKEQKVRG